LDEVSGSAMDRRWSILDALDEAIPGDSAAARDFILDNPRPEVEVEFELRLQSAGYENAYCRSLDQPPGMEVWLNRIGEPDEFFGPLVRVLRGIAAELHLRISSGSLRGRGQGNRIRVTFHLEPARPTIEHYYLNAEGQVVPGNWKGKLRAAALEAPQGHGCAAETDRRFVLMNNGGITVPQASAALARCDQGKSVVVYIVGPRRRARNG
jgi:hypothetical protein